MITMLLAVLFAISTASGPRTSAASTDISGLWDVRMTVAATADTIGGVLTLVPDSTRRNAWVALEDADYLGVYVIDLKGDGGPASTICPYPIVAAQAVRDSVVRVVLNPSQDHGSIDLTGRLKGGVIEGDWVESSYGRGRNGTFTMLRRQK